MRRSHFEALQPVCPRCRLERQVDVPLVLAVVADERDGSIMEGVLNCSDRTCLQEYPVVDGVPILVPGVRAYLSANLFHLTLRRDLSAAIESLLGDAAGPGTAFDATRQHLSTYGWDHYDEFDPERDPDDGRAGAVSHCLAESLALVPGEMRSPVLDIGCSVGRSTFDLAQQTDGLVLGVDVDFSMLQVAHGVLTSNTVRYPRRRVGIVYDRREFPVDFRGTDRVDFWACDSLALPFAGGSFGFAVGLNVLDCVGSPSGFLHSVAGVLTPGSSVVLSTPYDWSAHVTPIEGWIGGHSQRGPDRGASEPLLRSLLTPGAHPQASGRLELTGELEQVPWRARLHDRSTVEYSVHVVAAKVRQEETDG